MRFRKANTADLANDLSQLLDDLKEVLASKGAMRIRQRRCCSAGQHQRWRK